MSLTAAYNTEEGMYNSIDIKWVQFVRDHFLFIRNNYCTRRDIDPVEMNTYRFRMEDWLEDIVKIPQEAMWMILMLNQMTHQNEFDKLDYLILPDFYQVSSLYELYRSTDASKQMNLKD